MTPKVSFVVTCYNYARYLSQAIDSLLGQSFPELEVIAIDDASTDNSAHVLARYDDEPRVRAVVHERNRGHISSYNEGLALARGEYLGVLAADDFASSRDAVARQVALFEAHPTVGCVYSSYEMVDGDGRATEIAQPWQEDYVAPGLDEFRRLVWLNYIPHSGTLVRRACHEALGWYDERLPHSGDWDLWLRVATRYDVAYVAEPLYAYRVHDANMSHSKITPAQAMDELLLALDRNFALLPSSNGAGDLRELWPQARRQALLSQVWLDLARGRTGRSWAGLVAATMRSPRLLFDRAYLAAVLRAGALSLVGGDRYRRAFGGFKR